MKINVNILIYIIWSFISVTNVYFWTILDSFYDLKMTWWWFLIYFLPLNSLCVLVQVFFMGISRKRLCDKNCSIVNYFYLVKHPSVLLIHLVRDTILPQAISADRINIWSKHCRSEALKLGTIHAFKMCLEFFKTMFRRRYLRYATGYVIMIILIFF